MASLHWVRDPRPITYLEPLRDFPFIIGDDDDYIEGPNIYLQARCSNRIRVGDVQDVDDIGEIPHSPNTIKAIGDRLTNFVSWLYCSAAHPLQGLIRWWEVEEWQIAELYRDAMVQGFWTEEYWATGNKTPLNFRTTIRDRIVESLSCYRWMAKEGIVEFGTKRSLGYRQRAAIAAVSGYEQALPPKLRAFPEEKKFNRRADPNDWSPLEAVEIKAILKFFPKLKGAKLGALLFLTTGMRCDEVVKNTLVPGEMHKRSRYEVKLGLPANEYQLRYDLGTRRMVGVLPPPELASFGEGPDDLIEYKILGKNKKIRSAYLVRLLLRQLWRYYAADRPGLIKRCKTNPPRSSLLLNERGSALTARNIAYAINEARKAARKYLGKEVFATPHVFRHTFARFFLESNIASRAAEAGKDPFKLTLEEIMEFVSGPLASLQELLGHSFFKDTAKYIRQISRTLIGLQYLKIFSSAIGEVLFDEP